MSENPFRSLTSEDISPKDDGEPAAASSTLRRDSNPYFSSQPDASNAPLVNISSAPHTTPRPEYSEEPQWQMPIYENPQSHSRPKDDSSPEEFPVRRVSHLPLGPGPTDTRRGSGESDATLYDGVQQQDPYRKYSLSSYEHPYDIRPPQTAHTGPGPSAAQPPPKRSALRRNVSFSEEQPSVREYVPDEAIETIDHKTERALKRRGIPSNMLDLYTINATDTHRDAEKQAGMRRQDSDAESEEYGYSSARPGMRRADSGNSMTSAGSDVLDPDDPRVTGVEARYLDDPEDIEKNALRQMDYRARRKHLNRIRIEFNVTCNVSPSFLFPRFDHDYSNDKQTRILDQARKISHDIWRAIA
jgi:hypothetical protein